MGIILSIDQGTTSTTVALIDAGNLNLIGSMGQEFPQIYPRPGWVEHNLNDIWTSVETLTKKTLKANNRSSNDVTAIGITNQRETICAFSKSGRPLANAIVWQDRRTESYCKENKNTHEENFKKITGLPLDPYFSATKIKWLIENNEQVKEYAHKNDLLFGTVDTFLLYKLTNGEAFKTEGTNASRTLLMDLDTLNWSPELLNIFDIKKEWLPGICPSSGDFGFTKNLSFLPDGIPISGILGDQQAALFGQACFSPGEMKCTYGTGAFMLTNTGTKKLYSKSGLLTTVAYHGESETHYALEGSCYIAGAAVQWLRDNLALFNESRDVEELARKVSDLTQMENLLFLPFFSGIGSPYWVPNAKATIIGMTRDTDATHISRACLDGIALSINDLISAMSNDLKQDLTGLKVDGGAVKNNLLLEIQSTVSNIKIIRPEVTETTVYGAALAAGIGANIFTKEEIKNIWKEDKIFTPDQYHLDFYQKKKEQWTSAIKKIFIE